METLPYCGRFLFYFLLAWILAKCLALRPRCTDFLIMLRHVLIRLPAFERGYHLITDLVFEQLDALPTEGILHLFIQHTSAALTINEDADPTVRVDFESFFNYIVPENMPFLVHTMEGPDDMPAHIKAALIGSSISVPIMGGKLALGTWQGIYLCEFRNNASARKLIASIYS